MIALVALGQVGSFLALVLGFLPPWPYAAISTALMVVAALLLWVKEADDE